MLGPSSELIHIHGSVHGALRRGSDHSPRLDAELIERSLEAGGVDLEDEDVEAKLNHVMGYASMVLCSTWGATVQFMARCAGAAIIARGSTPSSLSVLV
jgi:hypothetical protein